MPTTWRINFELTSAWQMNWNLSQSPSFFNSVTFSWRRMMAAPPSSTAAESSPFAIAVFLAATYNAPIPDAGERRCEPHQGDHVEELIHLFGEENLTRRIAELMTSFADGNLPLEPDEAEALEVAARYATGWRPNRFLADLFASPVRAADVDPGSVDPGGEETNRSGGDVCVVG